MQKTERLALTHAELVGRISAIMATDDLSNDRKAQKIQDLLDARHEGEKHGH